MADNDDAKLTGSLFPHVVAITRNSLVRRVGRWLRPLIFSLVAYGSGVATTYLWREPKAWFSRVSQGLVDVGVLKHQVSDLSNAAESQARAARIERAEEREAVVATMRALVEASAARAHQPVSAVLSDYDQLVTNWLKSSPECSVQGGRCVKPNDAARMALAVRRPQ